MILHESGWDSPPGRPAWPHGQVHVWRTILDGPAGFIAGLMHSLSPDEQQRMHRFRFERDRTRYLVGRGLLRMLLGRYLDIAPHQLRFDYTSYGKPHLAPGLVPAPLQFNVSHSGEMMVIAVAAGRALGIDVEQIRADIEVGPMAARFFSPSEQSALAGLSGNVQIDAFFACWTRKEAYIKAKGEGLSLPLDQFDVSIMPEEACLLATRPDPAEAGRWSLTELNVAEGYKAAVAVEGFGWTLACWHWSPQHDRWQK